MMGTQSAMADERHPELPPAIRLARIGLATLAAVLSVNLWTGAPLLAIWVGSRVQGGTGLSMNAVGAVLGTLAVTVAILVFLLVRVEAAYKVLSGQPAPPRRATPWLRSLRDERPELAVRRSLSGFDKAIIATVVVAIAAFEVWFFVLAGSPIG